MGPELGGGSRKEAEQASPVPIARVGQCQDHSKAGTGAQMLGWHAPFPGQSFTDFLSLDGTHESLRRWATARPRLEV